VHFVAVALVVIESIFLAGLLAHRSRAVVRHSELTNPDPAKISPLFGALIYDAPDEKFEALVRQFPEWIPYPPPGASNTILAACAELMKTNYIRILLTNGADAAEAIREEQKMHNDKAIRLIKELELRSGR
jgi:hypothetical protein